MSLDLRFERLIAAPPKRVFDAFTDPAGQREFYGTDAPGWVVDSRCDLRVGGVWAIVHRSVHLSGEGGIRTLGRG